MDSRLSWETHVGRMASRVFYTLSLLNRFKKYASLDLRLYLVRTLIIPIFLYSDIVYFPALTGVAFRRLELAFNACVRYVFDLRYFDHVSEHAGNILGQDLFTHLEIRLAVFIHRVYLLSAPVYLSSYLNLGISSRHRLFSAPGPIPRTSLRNDSTIYRGIRLWNFLPAAAKESRTISSFKKEAERYLSGLSAADRIQGLQNHRHHHQTY